MRKIKKLFRCIKNYFFCKRYPFWKLTNDWYNFNTSVDDKRKGSKSFFVKYNYTWYDDIPEGWQKAFGKQLSEDIKQAFNKSREKNPKLRWEDALQFQQIKEKYGELCLYASSTREIEKVLEKYETMSIGYCIICGKPARYVTKGWVEYYCEDCFEKQECWKYDENHKRVSLDEESTKKVKEACRLTKKDIPTIHTYHKTLSGKYIKKRVNLKKKYNIDFKQLWNL